MYPVIFHIGSFPIHTYGIFLSLGFIIGTMYMLREAKKIGENPQNILDLAFWIFLSAMIGSRVLFIIVNIDKYIEYPLDIFKVWRGGLVYYGGFFVAFVVGVLFMRKREMDVWRICDITAPALLLGLSIGRFG